MVFAPRLISGPAREPIDLTFMKGHINTQLSDQDGMIDLYIKAARQRAETLRGELFITQTWEQTIDSFPTSLFEPIALQQKPVQSIGSISYLDTAGDSQTFGTSDGSPPVILEYRLIQDPESPSIVLNDGYLWPTSLSLQPGAVTIQFVAGYGDNPDDVPETDRYLIALLAAHFNENREPTATEVGISSIEIPWLITELFGIPRIG